MSITSITLLSRDEITALLDQADAHLDAIRLGKKTAPALEGKIVLNGFFEDSTRTRVSFETAALRLGAKVINFSAAASSLKKGETFDDTLKTLAMMHPDAFVVRAGEDDMPERAKAFMPCPVLNAGNGTKEHPTQALLDALVLRRHFGKLDGLKIAICGDIRHSRVAGSNILLLQKFGADIRLVGPEILLPSPQAGIRQFTEMDDGIAGADAVMMLRIQKERLQQNLEMSDADYFKHYGLTQQRLRHAAEHAVVLHPGPMNRGVEIAGDVADDEHRSLILQQVEAGVAVRMACLEHVLHHHMREAA
ncbi:MAG: aspartate carbamoyltransferase catalytic subunit [Alphaproteobacteria bacterium]|nr:MAG: aspartate carbamoyltransferase catalytic subunit [Alphaproteobacteria bacterium]